jgi:hypothetical protein
MAADAPSALVTNQRIADFRLDFRPLPNTPDMDLSAPVDEGKCHSQMLTE